MDMTYLGRGIAYALGAIPTRPGLRHRLLHGVSVVARARDGSDERVYQLNGDTEVDLKTAVARLSRRAAEDAAWENTPEAYRGQRQEGRDRGKRTVLVPSGAAGPGSTLLENLPLDEVLEKADALAVQVLRHWDARRVLTAGLSYVEPPDGNSAWFTRAIADTAERAFEIAEELRAAEPRRLVRFVRYDRRNDVQHASCPVCGVLVSSYFRRCMVDRTGTGVLPEGRLCNAELTSAVEQAYGVCRRCADDVRTPTDAPIDPRLEADVPLCGSMRCTAIANARSRGWDSRRHPAPPPSDGTVIWPWAWDGVQWTDTGVGLPEPR